MRKSCLVFSGRPIPVPAHLCRQERRVTTGLLSEPDVSQKERPDFKTEGDDPEISSLFPIQSAIPGIPPMDGIASDRRKSFFRSLT